jgi:hypothetical protein
MTLHLTSIDAPAPVSGWTPLEVVGLLVSDIEAAHGAGAAALRDDWPDMHVTYELALMVLADNGLVRD